MEVYLVVGTGKSGVAASNLLKEKNEKFYLYDGNVSLNKEGFFEKNPSLKGVELFLGEVPEHVKEEVTCAVLSPGVPTDSEFVLDLRKHNISLSGEVELAYTLGKGRVVAITGTNGKTTTTALTGLLMEQHFQDVRVVGNIGIPYTERVEDATDDSVFVAEISSFQLETCDTFAPKVSAILNITPDHLDRHHTMENYIAAKESVTKNQTKDDVCVLNYEDEVLRQFGKSLNCKVVYFSSASKLPDGVDGYYYNEGVIYKMPEEKIIAVEELNILGLHNYENAMAAIAMADAMGVEPEEIVRGLKAFHAVEHRIEYVCEKRGVRFYNDSKGTNPDAAIKGIEAMDRPTYLIGGGYDKNSTYDEWIDSFHGKVKKLVLIGQTKEKIAECAKAHGFMDYSFAESLKEAMDICYSEAKRGEAILLSPACASWGMFDNYEQRGDMFKEFARGYEE
ncbi:MAG: UDP-N-acetylmuramoyl-L-alanine--D-glutamate ligase [Lachnospiraceae bacterium]|nr:UDP-N-acetylmuramoyl-L-alanine--D-glutamate ligase [Lachnospiraceae bacterium]